jgi:hypothetical protein
MLTAAAISARFLSPGSSFFQRASEVSKPRSVIRTRMLCAMAGSGSGTTP